MLAWLDPDPDEAEKRLEVIHQKLVRKFAAERCPHPLDLASDTIVRVIRLIADGKITGDNPDAFFLGVATNIVHEDRRGRRKEEMTRAHVPVESLDRPAEATGEPVWVDETMKARLRRWLDQIDPPQQTLILRYYTGGKEGEAKAARKQLASDLGIDIEALHARALRLRRKLELFLKNTSGEGSVG